MFPGWSSNFRRENRHLSKGDENRGTKAPRFPAKKDEKRRVLPANFPREQKNLFAFSHPARIWHASCFVKSIPGGQAALRSGASGFALV
jgi:hypothetical protein